MRGCMSIRMEKWVKTSCYSGVRCQHPLHTSERDKSWGGGIKQLKFVMLKRVIWMESLCIKRHKSSSFSAKEMIRLVLFIRYRNMTWRWLYDTVWHHYHLLWIDRYSSHQQKADPPVRSILWHWINQGWPTGDPKTHRTIYSSLDITTGGDNN